MHFVSFVTLAAHGTETTQSPGLSRRGMCLLSPSQTRGITFWFSVCTAAISKMFWHRELKQYENLFNREREAGFLENHSSAYSVGEKSSLFICQQCHIYLWRSLTDRQFFLLLLCARMCVCVWCTCVAGKRNPCCKWSHRKNVSQCWRIWSSSLWDKGGLITHGCCRRTKPEVGNEATFTERR